MQKSEKKIEIVKAKSPTIVPAYQSAISQTAKHYQVMVAFVKAQMQKDLDYGVIPGTKKPTLLTGVQPLKSIYDKRFTEFGNIQTISKKLT